MCYWTYVQLRISGGNDIFGWSGELPLLLIFAGVIGGLMGFGAVGIFAGPVVLAVTYRLLESWVREGGL
jgi:predicted PurR-regulated permease PerM